MSNQPLTFGTATHPGLKRPVNEDALGTPPVALDPATLDAKGCLYLVADGMGREGNGAVASQLAVKRVVEKYYADPSPAPRQALQQAIQIANAEIIQQAAANPAYQGMGTTLTAVVIRGNALLAANVGDSRAYLVRGGAVQQLTQDHSWVAEQIRAGQPHANPGPDPPQTSARDPIAGRQTRRAGGFFPADSATGRCNSAMHRWPLGHGERWRDRASSRRSATADGRRPARDPGEPTRWGGLLVAGAEVLPSCCGILHVPCGIRRTRRFVLAAHQREVKHVTAKYHQ